MKKQLLVLLHTSSMQNLDSESVYGTICIARKGPGSTSEPFKVEYLCGRFCGRNPVNQKSIQGTENSTSLCDIQCLV